MGKPTSKNPAVRSFEHKVIKTCNDANFTRFGISKVVNNLRRIQQRMENVLNRNICSIIRQQLDDLLESALLGGEVADAMMPFYKDTTVVVEWDKYAKPTDTIVIRFDIADAVAVVVNTQACNNRYAMTIVVCDLLEEKDISTKNDTDFNWQTIYSGDSAKLTAAHGLKKSLPRVSEAMLLYIKHLVNNVLVPFSGYPDHYLEVDDDDESDEEYDESFF